MADRTRGFALAMKRATPLRVMGGAVLNALLPPRCLRCGTGTDRPGALCGACWEKVRFLAPPWCERCGFPFELPLPGETVCAACLARSPRFDRARAVMAYDDGSRDLVLGFKHADRTEGAPAYAAWMARAGADLLADADLIAPIPLHWQRLLRRRYNQAALLARELGRRESGTAVVVPDLLRRRRATPSQGYLSPAARWRNVRGAFEVTPRHAARVAGARVLLIDDVLTTGATVETCARRLFAAGAAGVDVLILARIVRERREGA